MKRVSRRFRSPRLTIIAEKITAHCLVGRVDGHANVSEQEKRI